MASRAGRRRAGEGRMSWLFAAIPLGRLGDPVTLAVPFFVLAIAAEMLWTHRRHLTHRYETRDAAASLVTGLISTVVSAATGFVVVAAMMAVWRLRLTTLTINAASLMGLFVAYDCTYYWHHRAMHRIRWFWADHIAHHSSQHYNLTTALRQPWLANLTGHFIFALPLVWLGFHPAAVGFVAALNLIYQFWIHTEAIGRCPAWFEAVFNTPSHHRVHHAANPRYLDRNYAGTLIVWDRMFGTFEPERAEEPPRYGLVHNIASFNPLRIVAHEYVGMARDAAGRGLSMRQRLAYIFAPPGWSHDGSRLSSDMLRARWRRGASDEPLAK